jgi:opacity protein-like surface antigen
MQALNRRSARSGIALAALLASIMLPGVARATDPADKYYYEVGLYLWGPMVAGDVDTDRGSASMHVSFSDLLKNLNVAGMLRARAQLDKFSIVFDGEYMDLESDREHRTIRLGPRGNLEIDANAKAELDMWIMELNGGYQLFQTRSPYAVGDASPMHFTTELYGGARYYSMKPSIDVNIGNFSNTFGERTTWVDGVVGLRFGMDLSKTVNFGVQGDVGGFDIGNSSKFSWSQITSLGWDVTDSMRIYLGYKFLDWKKDLGDSKYKIQLRGPFLASSIRF